MSMRDRVDIRCAPHTAIRGDPQSLSPCFSLSSLSITLSSDLVGKLMAFSGQKLLQLDLPTTSELAGGFL